MRANEGYPIYQTTPTKSAPAKQVQAPPNFSKALPAYQGSASNKAFGNAPVPQFEYSPGYGSNMMFPNIPYYSQYDYPFGPFKIQSQYNSPQYSQASTPPQYMPNLNKADLSSQSYIPYNAGPDTGSMSIAEQNAYKQNELWRLITGEPYPVYPLWLGQTSSDQTSFGGGAGGATAQAPKTVYYDGWGGGGGGGWGNGTKWQNNLINWRI